MGKPQNGQNNPTCKRMSHYWLKHRIKVDRYKNKSYRHIVDIAVVGESE